MRAVHGECSFCAGERLPRRLAGDPANAQKVLNAVSSGAMPPSNSGETSWSPDQVELFRSWITDGYQA
jgi:hypothetical protein